MEPSRSAGRARAWLSRVDRRWLARILVIGVVAFALGYAVTALLFFRGVKLPPVATVPDLREMEADRARRLVEEAGLELVVGDSLPHPDMAAGAVLAQSPLPGREVAPGTAVRVMLSAGPVLRSVPVVGALTRAQAESLLTSYGFQVQVREAADTRPAGRVVGVEPAPGTRVRVPSRVVLVVSAGPPMVAVPDVVGLAESEARAVLEGAGFRVGEADYVYQGLGALPTVLGQDPAPGDSLAQGSVVRIRVASDRLPGTPVR